MSTRSLEYQLIARNDIPDSPNPIHRDDYARSLGYPGGLVAGVTLYAYVCDAAVRLFGGDWLQHGYGSVDFRSPIFDSQELTIRSEPLDNGDYRVALIREDKLCTEAIVGPYREKIRADDLERSGPVEPEVLVKDVALAGTLLTSPDERCFDPEDLKQFIQKAGLQDTPLARELTSRGLVSPNTIAGAPFALLWRHRPYTVVIHTSSTTEWCGPARLGHTLYTWGMAQDAFEKRGRFYVTQRTVTVDDEGNAVARMLHTAAYEPSA